MKKLYLLFFIILSIKGHSQLAVECFEDTDFELVPAPGTPDDWLTLDNDIGPFTSWVIEPHQDMTNPSFEGTTGTHAAYMDKENVDPGTYAVDYLITPEFNLPAGAQLKFQSRLTTAADQGTIYKVMILPEDGDPSNINHYEDVMEWGEFEINPSQLLYNEITVIFPTEYENTDVRIAFVMIGDNMDRWLIDCVSVTEPCLDPVNLSAGNIGLDSAELSWDNPSGATMWEIEIVEEGMIPTGHGIEYMGLLPYVATSTASGDPLVQTPFSYDTGYKYYVRALCDGQGISEWVGALSFYTANYGDSCETPINIEELPFSTTDHTANYPNQHENAAGACSNFMGGNYISGNDVVYLFSPDFTGTVGLDFFNSEAYAGVFVYEECSDIGVNCLESGVSGYENFPVYLEFDVTAGEDYYILVSSWSYPQTVPFSLMLQQVYCDRPENLSVSNLSSTTASLLWDNPGEATSWEVEVQPQGSGMPDGNGEYVVNTNMGWAVPTEEISPYQAYEYYVRADCEDGNFSAWAGPYQFTTAVCPAENQCTYTFEMWGVEEGPWFFNTMDVIQNGITMATLSGPTTWGMGTIYQEIQMCSGYPFELFWNPGGFSTDMIGITVTNSYGQIIYTKPPGEGIPNSILYSEAMLDCDNPSCIAPNGLTVSNIDLTSADLGWNGPSDANWEFYVVQGGNPAPDDDTEGISTSINPSPIAGLDPASDYAYYAREVCEDAATDFSPWAGPYFFTTSICEPENKCDYTFVMKSAAWSGWDGGYMTITQNGINAAVIGPSFTSGETQEITVSLCHGLPIEVYFNSAGDISENYIGLTILNAFDQVLYELPYYQPDSLGTTLYTGTVDCLIPLCLPVTGLYAQNPAMTTIDIGWDGASTGNWQYYIAEAGEPAPTADTEGIDVMNNPAINVPLNNSGTHYEFYVRIACGGGETDYSSWAGPYDFYSDVCNDEDKCNFYFEMISDTGYGYEDNTMTIFQGGIPVATIGPEFNWIAPDLYSHTVEVALCPDLDFEIFWNISGWSSTDKGLVIYSPFLEDIYTMESSTEMPGNTIFQGLASCDPPLCFKPQNLSVSNVGLTEATLSWQEVGDAAEWAVWVLPIGSEAPTPDSEPMQIITDTQIIWGDNDGEELTSGTLYEYYVMSICGEDDGNSAVSGPFMFNTLLYNDDCENAVQLSVNPNTICEETVIGSWVGATFSGLQPNCTAMPVVDMWYTFVAEEPTHNVSLHNLPPAFLTGIAVFEGDECGTFSEVYCSFGNSLSMSSLVPGTTYYIQIFTYIATLPLSNFNVCLTTLPPAIAVNDSQYTVPQLVEDLLIGSDCVDISNITWLSGSDFGQSQSIGYFERNGSDFPFEEGIILSTGSINEAPGPNPGTPIFDEIWDWPGDQDLSQLIEPEGWTDVSYHATVLEFDFVSLIDQVTFDFLFASHEYGIFQCTFSDIFAFILTKPDGTTENLAVIPGTDIPVSVVTIKDGAYNVYCESENVEYFDQFNPDNPLNSAISYNGQTIPMEASADVIPGETYHIKLVIQDYKDGNVNSAVFLQGNSFGAPGIDLGPDLTLENENAVCAGGEVTIFTNLSADTYDFEWYFDDDPNDATEAVLLEGETQPMLVANPSMGGSSSGQYSVKAFYEATNCAREGEILVEFFEVQPGIPQNLHACSTSGFAIFDLSQNTPLLLDSEAIENIENYTVTYHISEDDAENGENSLDSLYSNVNPWTETIYARVEHILLGCAGVTNFNIIVNATPNFTLGDDITICEGTSGIIMVSPTDEPSNFDPETVTYAWTRNGEPLIETTQSILVSEAGIYEVTVVNNECINTASIAVSVDNLIVDEPNDVAACNEYVLPELSVNNSYYTGMGATGNILAAGTIITSSQIIYIYAENGICSDESSFMIDIISPQFVLEHSELGCNTTDFTVTVVPLNFQEKDVVYEWTINGIVTDQTEISITGTDFGTYEATVSLGGCTSRQSIEVIANPTVIMAEITDYCDGYDYTLEVNDLEGTFEPLTAIYNWTGPDGFTSLEQSIVVTDTGIYTVLVNSGGCEGSTSFEVISTYCMIPRGISPNNDGYNDNFDLSHLDVIYLSIFNRYGLNVYSMSNYTNQWHGQNNSGDELPSGTYYYVIERSNGEQITGWVYNNR